MLRRIVGLTRAAVIVTAGAALLAASPASAGDDFKLRIRKGEQPYARFSFANIPPGESKLFSLKVVDHTPTNVDTILDEDNPDVAGYKTKYFRNDNNITQQVKDSDGYAFDPGADGVQKFRMKVKVTSDSPPGPFCRRVMAYLDGPFGESDNIVAVLNDALCKI
jgi:hypothetical protein